ncbi:hypothetical protein PO909_032473 [Leuciscus waleckii]
MDSIVTESVRLNLTKKFGIHPEKVWSIEDCKKILGASIRKNNVKAIICCHREFSLSIAQEQAQCIAKLKEQNKQLHTQVSCLKKKVGHNKASTKCDSENQQSDETYPDLQFFYSIENNVNADVNPVEVCGARQKAQNRGKGVDPVPSATPIQAVKTSLGPKDIERLAEGLPSVQRHFSEFRRELSKKMRLYDMSLAEVTQLISQILTESEFNDFESAVNNSELQQVSKAVTYSGIVDDSESVLADKGALSRIWADGLIAEYRTALPFLDITWSNRTLRSNLDSLAIWERDSDVKERVRIVFFSFKVNSEKQKKRKCRKREGSCNYCGKPGHWMKECRKNKNNFKEVKGIAEDVLLPGG